MPIQWPSSTPCTHTTPLICNARHSLAPPVFTQVIVSDSSISRTKSKDKKLKDDNGWFQNRGLKVEEDWIEFGSYRRFSNMEETHRFTKGCLIKHSVSYVPLLKYWFSRNGGMLEMQLVLVWRSVSLVCFSFPIFTG